VCGGATGCVYPGVQTGVLAYHPGRGTSVLFGGSIHDGAEWVRQSQTWEWDGSTWTTICAEGSGCSTPTARAAAAMAYDGSRGRMVLFGGAADGVSGTTYLDDTWEWDPTCRCAEGRFGADCAGTCTCVHGTCDDDVYGTGSCACDAGYTGASCDTCAEGYQDNDGNGTCLPSCALTPCGGSGCDDSTGEAICACYPVGWMQTCGAGTDCTGPRERAHAGMVYDRSHGKIVLAGGTSSIRNWNDTWEWNGESWTQVCGDGTAWTCSQVGRSSHGLAYDAIRERVVMFGGSGSATSGETYEWDGFEWSLVCGFGTCGTSGTPEPRWGLGLVYDAARAKTLLFGGNGASRYDDTWEWDGSAWTQVCRRPTDCPRPLRRGMHMVAYDAARARVVLAGGYGDESAQADTWEWDGASWTQVCGGDTGCTYPGIHNGSLAYDPQRSTTLLFGGVVHDGTTWVSQNDTWEWNGSAWRVICDAGSGCLAPPGRWAGTMAFDEVRGRMVLFGGATEGVSGTTYLDDTWEWDPTCQCPDGKFGADCTGTCTCVHGACDQGVYGTGTCACEEGYTGASCDTCDAGYQDNDGDGTCLPSCAATACGAAGCDDSTGVAVCACDPVGWVQVCGPGTDCAGPPARSSTAMVYDASHRRTVLVGGSSPAAFGDTWEWDGATWTQVCGAGTAWTCGQAARPGLALTYDSLRERVVQFGGSAGGSRTAELYEWDGFEWRLLCGHGTCGTGVTPEPQFGSGLAYDAARGLTLLFGGYVGTGSTHSNESWHWNGTEWARTCTRPDTCPRPAARGTHVMAYDPVRERVVVAGGWTAGGGAASDTWEWDGSAWTQVCGGDTGCAYPGNQTTVMAYHGERETMMLFGGVVDVDGSWASTDTTWEWDGARWNLLCAGGTECPSPSPRWGAAMAYDAERGRMVVFGGKGASSDLSDTWEWDPTCR
jgi:hypothetical protein